MTPYPIVSSLTCSTVTRPTIPRISARPTDLGPMRRTAQSAAAASRGPRGVDRAWRRRFPVWLPEHHWEGKHLSDLDHLATTNHCILSLSMNGLSRSRWYRAIATGQLEQVYLGVARLHGPARTSEQRIAGAVLATRPSSMASHRSAAHLWGIPQPDDDPVDGDRRGRSSTVHRIRRGHDPPAQESRAPHGRRTGLLLRSCVTWCPDGKVQGTCRVAARSRRSAVGQPLNDTNWP